MKNATTEFEKLRHRVQQLEEENTSLKRDEKQATAKFEHAETELEKHISNYEELKRSYTEETQRTAKEIRDAQAELNKMKSELQTVSSYYEMARDNATTYKVERDELKAKYEALESDHVRVLKGLNPNDPRLIPAAKLQGLPSGEQPNGSARTVAPAVLKGSEEAK